MREIFDISTGSEIQMSSGLKGQYIANIKCEQSSFSRKHILHIEMSQKKPHERNVANYRTRGVKLYKQETVQTYDL